MFLGKGQKQTCFVTFQEAVLLLSLFDDVIFFSIMEKIATKTFWKIQPDVFPVFLSFAGPSVVGSGWVRVHAQDHRSRGDRLLAWPGTHACSLGWMHGLAGGGPRCNATQEEHLRTTQCCHFHLHSFL